METLIIEDPLWHAPAFQWLFLLSFPMAGAITAAFVPSTARYLLAQVTAYIACVSFGLSDFSFPLIGPFFLAEAYLGFRCIRTRHIHQSVPSFLFFPVTIVMASPAAFTLFQEHRCPDPDGIQLTMPLPGKVAIGNAGVTRRFNHHADVPGQRWAVDMSRPLTFHDLLAGLTGKPECGSSFGVPVLSPCNGTIVAAKDYMPDQPVGTRRPRESAGNFVIVQCSQTTPIAAVLLAHLRKDSVSVKTGQTVAAGDHIGQIGNTGNTTRPHLHVEAREVRSPEPAHTLSLPMWFDGRFLRAHDVVEKGPS